MAVDSVDLAMGSGEFFSLPGPSGCGKTTTLRLIVGDPLRPDHGVAAAVTCPARAGRRSLTWPPRLVPGPAGR